MIDNIGPMRADAGGGSGQKQSSADSLIHKENMRRQPLASAKRPPLN